MRTKATLAVALCVSATAIAALIALPGRTSTASAQSSAQPTVSADVPAVLALNQPLRVRYSVTIPGDGQFSLYLVPPNTACGGTYGSSGAMTIARGSADSPRVFAATVTTSSMLQIQGAWTLCASTAPGAWFPNGPFDVFTVATVEVSEACADANRDLQTAAESYRRTLLAMRRARGSRRAELARVVAQKRAATRAARGTRQSVCVGSGTI